MTDQSTLNAIEIRSIAEKYLIREREPELRTEEPLPADYEAFRDEYSAEADDEAIRTFEDEWGDLYHEQRA